MNNIGFFSLSLLAELHNLIRTINPYSMAYKMMHEIDKGEYKKAEDCRLLSKEIKMYKYMVRNNLLIRRIMVL